MSEFFEQRGVAIHIALIYFFGSNLSYGKLIIQLILIINDPSLIQNNPPKPKCFFYYILIITKAREKLKDIEKIDFYKFFQPL